MNKELIKSAFKNFSFAAIVIAFAVWPLPGIEGNPTGFQLFHSHAVKYISLNAMAISNTHETMIAMDDRKGFEFDRFHIEELMLRVEESEKITPERKEALLKRYERKLERIEKSLEKKNDRIDELNGLWSGYGYAVVSKESE